MAAMAPTERPPQLENFLMRLAQALHRFGTPADRLEEVLGRISQRLKLPAQFLATPTYVLATFGEGAQGHAQLSRSDQRTADLARLSRLERLAQQVVEGTVLPEAASRAVDDILSAPPIYAATTVVAAYGGASAAMARLFGGGWAEMAVAGGIGLLLGLLTDVAARYARLERLLELTAATLSAVLAAGASHLVGPYGQSTATLAGLIVLMPGLAATTALTELSTGNLVSGTARLMGAVVSFMKLGFGVALGHRLGQLLFGQPVEVAAHTLFWTEWPALCAAALALAVLLQAERREIVFILGVGLSGLLGLRGGAHLLGADLAPAVAAFVVTCGSNAYASKLGRTASVTQVPAMLLLVPGSVGYRSVAALMHRDVLGGMQAAFAMVLTATALVAGALLAGILMPPEKDA